MLGWAPLLAATAAPQPEAAPGYPGPQAPDDGFARITRHQAPAAAVPERALVAARLGAAVTLPE